MGVRLILSRKGFDSSFGGFPSPILPDGRLVSIPISEPRSKTSYGALRPRGIDLGQIVSDLTNGRTSAREPAHLDPDLEESSRPRLTGWRPAFGQVSSAQRHLESRGVGPGALFLFFGWFRQTERFRGRLRYVPRAPDLHIIFGWLRVETILRVGPDSVPEWLGDHPHATLDLWRYNTIYVAPPQEGAGVFDTFDQRLQLTQSGKQRSQWVLPADFYPRGRRALSYHEAPDRWTELENGCRLRAVARGQEFVLDLALYPGVAAWLADLIQDASRESADGSKKHALGIA